MTEKEKMLAGEYYKYSDPELMNRWHHAKTLQREYAMADSRDSSRINAILDDLIGSRGENVWITAPLFVDYGENIHLGNNVEINMNCVFLDCNRITIGDHCGIGPGVHFYAVTHPVNPNERISPESNFWTATTAPITLGRNVWIGGGSIILCGVTIGDNCTIGAGSVVTRSIPPNSLAAGNPCKVIRTLNE